MTQTFKLTRCGERASISPSCGEDLGAALSGFAEARELSFREKPESRVMFWGNTVAQVYYLAAEAYEQGASASIGHNRTDRYEARARVLRGKADSILAEAKADREAAESVTLTRAYLDGFNGGDAARHSFDNREAFLVGRHFAATGLPAVESVRLVRGDAGAHWIEAGGVRYLVEYPGGRIPDATVTAIA